MRFLLAVLVLMPSLALAETLIVRFKDKPQTASIAAIKATAKHQAFDGKIAVVDGDLKTLQANPDVEYVEKDFKVYAMGHPSKSVSIMANPKAWGLTKIQVAKMWAKGYKGGGIKIAVIDTGVDPNHPELKGRVLKGFNAIDGSSNSMDDMGHGTHCSGTIAGKNVGVAPTAKIVPVKFLDAQGAGDVSDAIKGIEWASRQGVKIMSNSWGGGGYSRALEEVIRNAAAKGIWFTAAAGNESNNNDASPSYPASYKVWNVISVAATDPNDVIADFSNYGAKSVYIAAPGVGIYSSLPGGKYAAWDGTSMATPHISGAAALLIQSGCTDVKTCLSKNYAKVPGLKGKDKLAGRMEFK